MAQIARWPLVIHLNDYRLHIHPTATLYTPGSKAAKRKPPIGLYLVEPGALEESPLATFTSEKKVMLFLKAFGVTELPQ